jgi:hypothetical protein
MPVPVRAFSLRPPSHPLLRRLVLLAVALFVLEVGRADADTITLSASFVASGFREGAPVDPVRGSYSITFDDDLFILEQTTGITISDLNIAIDGPPAFFYDPRTDLLILGSTFNGLLTVFRATNDFFLTVGHASTHPINVQLVYAQTGTDIFVGKATLTPTSVPEPSTLALVLTGAIVAALGRRMRRGTDREVSGALRSVAAHRSTASV